MPTCRTNYEKCIATNWSRKSNSSLPCQRIPIRFLKRSWQIIIASVLLHMYYCFKNSHKPIINFQVEIIFLCMAATDTNNNSKHQKLPWQYIQSKAQTVTYEELRHGIYFEEYPEWANQNSDSKILKEFQNQPNLRDLKRLISNSIKNSHKPIS